MGGAWTPLEACIRANPFCTDGLCVGLRLVGRIGALGTAEGPVHMLSEQSLEQLPRVCDARFCLTGGIRP